MPASRDPRPGSPVIVEVRPSDLDSTVTPPASPQSSKAVRFAPTSSGLVTGVTRPLTSAEAWSLYHFEVHARQCRRCNDPVAVLGHGGQLCADGQGLARDVQLHVYHYGGDVYSTTKDGQRRPVRVEISPAYLHVRSLLRALARRASRSTVPIITYERPPPRRNVTSPTAAYVSSSASDSDDDDDNYGDEFDGERGLSRRSPVRPREVTIQPASSQRERERRPYRYSSTTTSSASSTSRLNPQQNSSRYRPVVVHDVNDDGEEVEDEEALDGLDGSLTREASAAAFSDPPHSPSPPQRPRESTSASTSSPARHRGSLYESDRKRDLKERGYRVEARREPSKVSSKSPKSSSQSKEARSKEYVSSSPSRAERPRRREREERRERPKSGFFG